MINIHKQTLMLMTILCSSLLVGCSKKGGSSNSSQTSEPKIKLHEIGIEVKRDQLSLNQEQLISQIDEKKIVDQNLLLEIILEIHKGEFLSSGFQTPGSEINPPLIGYFDSLLDSVSQDTDPHGFKTGYEKNLLNLHSGQSMKYNKAHTSVFSPVFANRMQCYSGTVFFNLLYGRLKKSAFFEANQVFIYEDGHVLPGYMSKVNDQWHMFGIETTLGGAAKKIYGPTSGLRGVRVVDAHLALGIEALKNQITNKALVMKTTLEKTAKLYDIPLEQTETSLSNVSISMDGTLGSGTTVSDTNSYLNSSLFSFGDSSQVPSGDQDRESVDEFTAKPGSSGTSILSDPGNWRNQLTANPGTTGGSLPGSQVPVAGPQDPATPQRRWRFSPDPSYIDSLFENNDFENEKIYIKPDLMGTTLYEITGPVAAKWRRKLNDFFLCRDQILSHEHNNCYLPGLFYYIGEEDNINEFKSRFPGLLPQNSDSLIVYGCKMTHPSHDTSEEWWQLKLPYYNRLYVGDRKKQEVHMLCGENNHYVVLRTGRGRRSTWKENKDKAWMGVISGKIIFDVSGEKSSKADLFIFDNSSYFQSIE